MQIRRRALQGSAVPGSTTCRFIASQQQRSAHPGGGQADLAVLKGPGCVRHVWLLPGKKTKLVIHVDGVATPQVQLPLQPFWCDAWAGSLSH